jgi:penicillin-binding protein 1B
VAISPDGRLLALRGSRSGAAGELDRAVAAHRSIGSLVKPFVLATALQQGWSPDFELKDEPLSLQVGAEVWEPKNSDGKYRGTVSVRDAVVLSLNVPMVRLGLEVGVDNVVATLRRVGLEPGGSNPAVLLGAFAGTPAQVARAYAALANGGRSPALRLTEGSAPEARHVLDPGVAGMVLSVLEEVPRRGTAAALAGKVTGRLGCKTGTTDDRRDSWFVAVRPRLVTVVWVGTDGNRETGLYGATGALEVWRAIDERMPQIWRLGELPSR